MDWFKPLVFLGSIKNRLFFFIIIDDYQKISQLKNTYKALYISILQHIIEFVFTNFQKTIQIA